MPGRMRTGAAGLPAAQGLYDPAHEHDGCGMGFVAHLRGARSHDVMRNALLLLENLEHRSAVGSEPSLVPASLPTALRCSRFSRSSSALRSHDVMRNALLLLENLEHRSAVGSDAGTSDGSGVLFQVPHAFLRAACAKTHIAIPDSGQYGVGMIFLPRGRAQQRAVELEIEDIARSHGCRLLGWRNVPVNERHI